MIARYVPATVSIIMAKDSASTNSNDPARCRSSISKCCGGVDVKSSTQGEGPTTASEGATGGQNTSTGEGSAYSEGTPTKCHRSRCRNS